MKNLLIAILALSILAACRSTNGVGRSERASDAMTDMKAAMSVAPVQITAATTSLIATGGGLLFGGDVNGRFRALDQQTGSVLWEVDLGSQVTGFPITFAVDGAQYVAVSTGTSLTTDQLLYLTRELHPSNSNTLFVFALPD